MSEERYDPQDKFGHPEDEPAVYYDEDGNRVSEEEWLRSVRVAAGNAGSELGNTEEYDHSEKFGYPEQWGQVEYQDENGNPLSPREFMESIGLEVPDDLGTGPPDAGQSPSAGER